MNEHDSLSCGKQIEQTLVQQIEQVNDYSSYLGEMKTAISNNRISTLNELLEKPLENPQQIEQTRQQQEQLLKHYGFELSEEGLMNCIQQCHGSKQLLALKETLTDKLTELENSLLVNSQLVQKSQQRIKQSIRLLSGHNFDNTSAGYSRQGQMENSEITKKTLAQV